MVQTPVLLKERTQHISVAEMMSRCNRLVVSTTMATLHLKDLLLPRSVKNKSPVLLDEMKHTIPVQRWIHDFGRRSSIQRVPVQW